MIERSRVFDLINQWPAVAYSQMACTLLLFNTHLEAQT